MNVRDLFYFDNWLYSLSSKKGRVLRAVETVEEVGLQMGRPKKVPYQGDVGGGGGGGHGGL